MRASRKLRIRGRFVRNIEREILHDMVSEVLPSLVQSMRRMYDIQRIQNERLRKKGA